MKGVGARVSPPACALAICRLCCGGGGGGGSRLESFWRCTCPLCFVRRGFSQSGMSGQRFHCALKTISQPKWRNWTLEPFCLYSPPRFSRSYRDASSFSTSLPSLPPPSSCFIFSPFHLARLPLNASNNAAPADAMFLVCMPDMQMRYKPSVDLS